MIHWKLTEFIMHLVITSKSADKQFFMFFMYSFFCIILATSADILYAAAVTVFILLVNSACRVKIMKVM